MREATGIRSTLDTTGAWLGLGVEVGLGVAVVVGFGVGVVVSSSTIESVARLCDPTIAPPVGVESVIPTVSIFSMAVSLIMEMANVFEFASPAAQDNVPEAEV